MVVLMFDVAHPCLDVGDRRRVDREQPERVAQVVEAQEAQTSSIEVVYVAAAQSRAVDRAMVLADEHGSLGCVWCSWPFRRLSGVATS
jgi:hypothetical protein